MSTLFCRGERIVTWRRRWYQGAPADAARGTDKKPGLRRRYWFRRTGDGMTLELFWLKLMNAAVVVVFFGLIIWLLRFLYGPKGRFRDPQWDRWNEEARLKLERELDATADRALSERFEAYARGFFTGDDEHDRHLRLKMDHTANVLANAREIAAAEKDFSPEGYGRDASRALALAALFHDVGRFAQYARYGTFADPLSCDHGRLGASIVRREGFLERENPEIRRLAVLAVALHNRHAVPGRMPGKPRAVLEALRDADKLDILRVMADHLGPEPQRDGVVLLHLADEPGAVSPAVLGALKDGTPALYADMRSYNDFRLLLCTWPGALRYGASLVIAKREGHMERILDGLYGVPEAQALARARVAAAFG